MGSLRLLGVLALALTLAGCVAAVDVPEPGFSDAELAERQQALGDNIWQFTGLPSELRPDDPPTVFLSGIEWADQFVGCMNDAGFDNYTSVPGSYSVEDRGRNEAELQAYYTCNLSYVVDYAEMGELNHAQAEYWYDYFKEQLVPCLENHDVVMFEAPTLAEFRQGFGTWNPYWSVRPKDQQFALADERLHRECPFAPPGVDYPDPFPGD